MINVTPKAGGEADKIGNAYESAWVAFHILQLISGTADSIAIERGEYDVDGIEFEVVRSSGTEVHQTKRQAGSSEKWTFAALDREGVWHTAASHTSAGRAFHFISMVPARPIQELSERARLSMSPDDFSSRQLTNDDLRKWWDLFCQHPSFANTAAVWTMLRGFWFHVMDHNQLDRVNDAMAGVLFEGLGGRLVTAGIGRIALETIGLRLDREEIVRRLSDLGLSLAESASWEQSAAGVREATQRWVRSVSVMLLEPEIERVETRLVLQAAYEAKVSFVVGRAGWGKSGVAKQAVSAMLAADVPVLAIRLDRTDSYATSRELGAAVGLRGSPVMELARMAGDRESVLVVDQLDAVSLASGRMPRGFDVVTDLLAESQASPRMHLVFVVREFDLKNDERFRALFDRSDAHRVDVGLLQPEQVAEAVRSLGMNPASLTRPQVDLLRSPLHLHLLAGVVTDSGGWRSTSDLLAAYWDRKRLDVLAKNPSTRFTETIQYLAEIMSARQQLSILEGELEGAGMWNDVIALEGDGVIVRDSGRVAFFHEMFFDYAFARAWALRKESLTTFLLDGEQELFVRAQVRQILYYLRATDVQRYRTEFLELVASDRVRFHLKDAALTTLVALDDPAAEDVILLEAIWQIDALARRAGAVHQSSRWSIVFNDVGILDGWLTSEEPSDIQRAEAVILALAELEPEASIAKARATPEDRQPDLLLRMCRLPALHNNQELRDLILEYMRAGSFDQPERYVWYALAELIETDPEYGLKLVRASLIENAAAFVVEEGQVRSLKVRNSSIDDVLERLSASRPLDFALLGVELVGRVSELTAYPDQDGIRLDHHFSIRFHGASHDDLDDQLFHLTSRALRLAASQSPEEIWPLLKRMAGSDLESIAVLLYAAIEGAPQRFSDFAIELLRTGPYRFELGNSENPVWLSRQLIGAIGPFVSDRDFEWLEDEVRDRTLPHERRPFRRYAHALLSALPPSRLSVTGLRRVQEYQRLFGAVRSPQGIRSGTFRSPISPDRARFMNDHQWRTAMRAHLGERENWDRFVGGAAELGHVLQGQVKDDPERFAQLALTLDRELAVAYGSSILIGLGETERDVASDAILNAIQWMASFEESGLDRWLSYPLRHLMHEVTNEFLDLLLERAVSSEDPSIDRMRARGERKADEDSTRDVLSLAINSARGSLVEGIADLVIEDKDGSRTAHASPFLEKVANDGALPVRVVGTRLVHACMRFDAGRADPVALSLVVREPDLLAYRQAVWMCFSLGNRTPEVLDDVIRAAAQSEEDAVRKNAGSMAAFAAIEWSRSHLLEEVLAAGDVQTLSGVASMCASRVLVAENTLLAKTTTLSLLDHESELVRKEAADVIESLVGSSLSQNADVILAVIASSSLQLAMNDLDRLLKQAVEPIHEFVIAAVDRWVAEGNGDSDWSNVGSSIDLAELLVRALAQADTADLRSRLLDAVDDLVAAGGYGVDSVIAEAER